MARLLLGPSLAPRALCNALAKARPPEAPLTALAPDAREHFQKIVSVVQSFKKQTGKPVFLIGHSNGAISLAEFLNRSPTHQKLIAGAIFSGSRNEAEIKASLNLRVLIMNHEEDPNSFTTRASAERLYEAAHLVSVFIGRRPK